MAGNIQTFTVTGAGPHTFSITNFRDDYTNCQWASWAFDGIDWTPGPVAGPTRFAGSGENPNQNNPTGTASEPVNTWSGNYTHQESDLALPGRGLPFAFARSYNSSVSSDGPLGPGWTDTYAATLTLNADGSATFSAEDGAQIPFLPDGSGGYVAGQGVLSTLAALTSGYTVTRKDGLVYHFDGTGHLTNEVDRNGNTIAFAYTAGDMTAITDTVGRVMTLTYDANHHLQTLADPTGRTVTYSYDATGHLTTVTDVRGGLTTYAYDANGRLATVTDQNGHVLVTNTYDSNGRVIDQADARGYHTTFAWDAVAQTCTVTDALGGTTVDTYSGPMLVSRRDPLGNVTTYGYDGLFDRTSITDPRGNTTAMTYDGRGNLLTRTAPAPLSYVESSTYNGSNEPLTHVDGRGNTTTYTYDAAGNLLTVTGPAPISPVTTYSYDPAGTGLVVSVTDPRGKVTTYGYDAQANRNRITSPLGEVTTMTYDGAGRMASRVDPRGNAAGGTPSQYTTTYTYDSAGDVLTVTDPLGNVTTTTYDPAGNRLTVTDANNHTTTYGYDAGNHLASVTDATGLVTSYAYDPVGNLVSRTDANGHVTTYAYDLAGHLTSETRPLNRVRTYGYDANGNRTQVVDPIGNSTPIVGDGTTTYAYDQLNRLTGITYSDGTPSVSYGYDANSNRTQMADIATTTYTYDALNRPTAIVRSPSLEIDYTYDAAGNILSRSPVGGTAATYTYDDDGRMAMMTVAGASTTYAHDPAGNLTSTTYPGTNGYVETRTYDRAGRLTEVKNAKGTSTLSKSTYTLDPVGNRLTNTTTTGVTTYAYDVLDRLTQACFTTACTGPGDNLRRYTYDPVGNRLTEVTASGTTTYTYDAADELTQTSDPSGTTTYGYDLDGNETAAGTAGFTYDLAGRTKTATVAGTTTTYTYDGDGHRSSAATGSQANRTTRFLWDLNGPLPLLAREMDGNYSLIREYESGADLVSMRSGGSAYYFHHDGLGSVMNVTSSTGATQWTYDYFPFGATKTATKNNNKAPTNLLEFAGQYLDPTGLYHLRARQYDPSTGRFTSVDPLTQPIAKPCVSAYSYAQNNPVRYVDPSGLDSRAPGGSAQQPGAVRNPAGCLTAIGGGALLSLWGAVEIVAGAGLAGFSVEIFGVTFGAATPVTVASSAGAAMLAGTGIAAEYASWIAFSKACLESR